MMVALYVCALLLTNTLFAAPQTPEELFLPNFEDVMNEELKGKLQKLTEDGRLIAQNVIANRGAQAPGAGASIQVALTGQGFAPLQVEYELRDKGYNGMELYLGIQAFETRVVRTPGEFSQMLQEMDSFMRILPVPDPADPRFGAPADRQPSKMVGKKLGQPAWGEEVVVALFSDLTPNRFFLESLSMDPAGRTALVTYKEDPIYYLNVGVRKPSKHFSFHIIRVPRTFLPEGFEVRFVRVSQEP